ncbi:hypothetical protein SDC9_92953 [bioreactor metagenome]|uniref:Uncharacterized protein n=1 Tax=bioreactor metagenome TaxID=1076179 RepID=A0A644ZZ67_9ZZZZ
MVGAETPALPEAVKRACRPAACLCWDEAPPRCADHPEAAKQPALVPRPLGRAALAQKPSDPQRVPGRDFQRVFRPLSQPDFRLVSQPAFQWASGPASERAFRPRALLAPQDFQPPALLQLPHGLDGELLPSDGSPLPQLSFGLPLRLCGLHPALPLRCLRPLRCAGGAPPRRP